MNPLDTGTETDLCIYTTKHESVKYFWQSKKERDENLLSWGGKN